MPAWGAGWSVTPFRAFLQKQYHRQTCMDRLLHFWIECTKPRTIRCFAKTQNNIVIFCSAETEIPFVCGTPVMTNCIHRNRNVLLSYLIYSRFSDYKGGKRNTVLLACMPKLPSDLDAIHRRLQTFCAKKVHCLAGNASGRYEYHRRHFKVYKNMSLTVFCVSLLIEGRTSAPRCS